MWDRPLVPSATLAQQCTLTNLRAGIYVYPYAINARGQVVRTTILVSCVHFGPMEVSRTLVRFQGRTTARHALSTTRDRSWGPVEVRSPGMGTRARQQCSDHPRPRRSAVRRNVRHPNPGDTRPRAAGEKAMSDSHWLGQFWKSSVAPCYVLLCLSSSGSRGAEAGRERTAPS